MWSRRRRRRHRGCRRRRRRRRPDPLRAERPSICVLTMFNLACIVWIAFFCLHFLFQFRPFGAWAVGGSSFFSFFFP